jgi:ubiquinone/menaquinone biosynthesis C-methylase UbiE
MSLGSLLHVGCGGEPMPEWAVGKYLEVRLDVSADHQPDILASMTDMGDIGEFDAIHCCHALEHLVPHEVALALSEFQRVLKPGGFALVFVPDLQGVKATEDVLFTAPCGPVAGLDLMYGLRRLLPTMPYMAHRTGFVQDTLSAAFKAAGFSRVVTQRLENYNLMAAAVK